MSEPCAWCAQNFPAVDGRDVAALQDPRPMAVIGAAGTDGEACFATVIWVTPLSHTPPMLAFALREKSRTMQLIKQVHARGDRARGILRHHLGKQGRQGCACRAFHGNRTKRGGRPRARDGVFVDRLRSGKHPGNG